MCVLTACVWCLHAAPASVILSHLLAALSLIQNSSVFTLGQNSIYPGAAVCNSNITDAIIAGFNATCVAPPLLPRTPLQGLYGINHPL